MTDLTDSGLLQRRDPRLDKAITWALTTAAALAFGWGAYSFRALADEVRAVRLDLAVITTRIAIVESERSRERIDKLEERMRALEGRAR